MRNNTIPKGQKWIVDRMQALGYISSQKGICFGIACMGAQMMLTDRIDTFNEYLQYIHSISSQQFRDVMNDTHEGQDPLLKTNLLAFLDGIELYQQDYLYPHLYEIKPKNQNFLRTSSLVFSDNDKEHHNLIFAGQFSGFYTRNELISYFDELCVTASTTRSLEPFILTLSDIYHTIAVGYHVQKHRWIFIDGNQLPAKSVKHSETVADLVLRAFDRDKVVFGTEIYGVESNKNALSACVDDWIDHTKWQKIHTVSTVKAITLANRFDISWLYVAISQGNHKLVRILLIAGANPNYHPLDRLSPLQMAICLGFNRVVGLLLQAGANPDYNTSVLPHTPLCLASRENDLKSVFRLLQAYANPNHYCCQRPPLFEAVKNGHIDIVRLLLIRNANTQFSAYYSSYELRSWSTRQAMKVKIEMMIQNQGNALLVRLSLEEIALLYGHTEIAHLLKYKRLLDQGLFHTPRHYLALKKFYYYCLNAPRDQFIGLLAQYKSLYEIDAQQKYYKTNFTSLNLFQQCQKVLSDEREMETFYTQARP